MAVAAIAVVVTAEAALAEAALAVARVGGWARRREASPSTGGGRHPPPDNMMIKRMRPQTSHKAAKQTRTRDTTRTRTGRPPRPSTLQTTLASLPLQAEALPTHQPTHPPTEDDNGRETAHGNAGHERQQRIGRTCVLWAEQGTPDEPVTSMDLSSSDGYSWWLLLTRPLRVRTRARVSDGYS